MTVTYDQFYELFMATNPNIVYSDEDEKAGRTLDKLLGSDLVVRDSGNRDIDLPNLKMKLEKGHSIALARPDKCFSHAVFIHSEFLNGIYQKHEVSYTQVGLEYFSRIPGKPE